MEALQVIEITFAISDRVLHINSQINLVQEVPMNTNTALEIIEKQILQIESYLWDREFNHSFRVKRLIENEWELLTWKPQLGRYRLVYTRIASFELSGGIPEVEVALAEASEEIKLKIGPHLESFMMRYFQFSEDLKKQTDHIESFTSYLSSLEQKIKDSQVEIRRVVNEANN